MYSSSIFIVFLTACLVFAVITVELLRRDEWLFSALAFLLGVFTVINLVLYYNAN